MRPLTETSKLDRSAKNYSTSPANRLRCQYLCALSLVAALVIVTQFIVQAMIGEQKLDAPLVNLAGRQRMLSQQISKLALQIRAAPSETTQAKLIGSLEESVVKWKAAHKQLLASHQHKTAEDIQIRERFDQLTPVYERILQSCRNIVNGGQLLDRYIVRILDNEPSYLVQMDEIVGLMDQHAVANVSKLRQFELALLAGILVVLALVGLFIFEPAARTIAEQFRENVQANRRLDAQLKAIDQSQARIEFSTKGIILDVNERLLSILGYERYEVVGESHSLLLPKSQLNVSKHNDFWRKLSNGEYQTGEFERMTHTGHIRWFQATYMPVRNSAGDIERILFYGTDVSDRKSAENEKKRLGRELQDASRQAGVAQVATSILHNVGNVLNSVNVSTTLLRERIDALPIESLSKAAGLVKDHKDDLPEFLTQDNRGKNFPGFLEAVAGHVQSEREQQLEELSVLAKSIEHIKEIVSKQQSLAKKSGLVEIIEPAELFEDAIALNNNSSHAKISIVRDYEDVPAVQTKRHETLQVLVNFMKNACQATLESVVEEKIVELSLKTDAGYICFEVRDNGVGIDPNMLEHIFECGYTTKTSGHGFGLHSCAIAAQDLGGTVSAKSDGRNQGAAFTLRIPVNLSDSQHLHTSAMSRA